MTRLLKKRTHFGNSLQVHCRCFVDAELDFTINYEVYYVKLNFRFTIKDSTESNPNPNANIVDNQIAQQL